MTTHEHGCRGRRKHPGEPGVSPALCDSRRDRGLEHRPRIASVADDQRLRPPAAGLGRRRGRVADGDRQLGRQLGSGNPPDPIGTEELFHGLVSAC